MPEGEMEKKGRWRNGREEEKMQRCQTPMLYSHSYSVGPADEMSLTDLFHLICEVLLFDG